MLLENQYQELELWYPVIRLREEGATVVVVGPETGRPYASKIGYPAFADVAAKDVSADDFDAVIIPGGHSPEGMRRHQEMIDLVRDAHANGALVAAICHAGWMLASSGVARGKNATCVSIIKDDLINAGANYVDSAVVQDGNLITSRLPSDLPDFTTAIAEYLGKSDHQRAGKRDLAAEINIQSTGEYNRSVAMKPSPRGVASPNYTQVAV